MPFLIFLINCVEPFASFSNTYANVQSNSEQIWKFERCLLIMEYVNRPRLLPPLVLLYQIYIFVKFLIDKCRSQQQENNSGT